MVYVGKSIEKTMYYGAKKDIILRARELRKNMTKAEEKLWSALRAKKLDGYIFRRQHPIDIFIVDFYCHELRLIIEVDGSVHDIPEVSSHDLGRAAELERFGLNIVRFSNDEVLSNIQDVICSIRKYIKTVQ